jgi:uridine kinase
VGNTLLKFDLNEKKLKDRYKEIIKSIKPNTLKNIKENNFPYIIAFTGASSSGKTYLAKLLAQILSEEFSVSYFSQDNYYRCFKTDFSPKYTLEEFYKKINFDDPNHFKFDNLKNDLFSIKGAPLGSSFYLPKITFGTDIYFPFIEEKILPIEVAQIIITEGVYSLTNPEVNKLYDLSFFIDMDHDVRKENWVKRNLKEGRFFNEHMWETTVDSLKAHIKPTRKYADIVIDNSKLSEDCEKFFRSLFFGSPLI